MDGFGSIKLSLSLLIFHIGGATDHNPTRSTFNATTIGMVAVCQSCYGFGADVF